MLYSRGAFNDISFSYYLSGFPLFLIITYAFCNDQNLSTGMCVPICSYPGLKRYKRYNAIQRIAGRNKSVKPYCSIEIIAGRDFFTAWKIEFTIAVVSIFFLR